MLSCSPSVIGRSMGSMMVRPLGLGRGLPAQQEIVDLPVDELAVALEVRLVDVQACGEAEEALEFRDAHHVHGGHLLAGACGKGVRCRDPPPP